MYAYERFSCPYNSTINEVNWRGGYLYGGMYGRVNNFSIYIYESIVNDSQPHVNNPEFENIYLARYIVNGIAGETPAGTYGGYPMYDYKYVLPQPFHAVGGVKYWIRIEGYQPTIPDWGICTGLGGNGSYFRFSTGMAMFQFASGDPCYILKGT